MGVQIQALKASTNLEINAAFATLMRDRPDALFVGPDAFFNSRRLQLANMAARHAIPMTSSSRDIAEVGGLMSYGTNITDVFRQLGVTPAAFSRVLGRPTFRSSGRPRSSLLSITRPPGCSASPCRRCCCQSPTR